MFGLHNFTILCVYLLCILSTIACVVYGAINWNKGAVDEETQIKEEMKWQQNELNGQ